MIVKEQLKELMGYQHGLFPTRKPEEKLRRVLELRRNSVARLIATWVTFGRDVPPDWVEVFQFCENSIQWLNGRKTRI